MKKYVYLSIAFLALAVSCNTQKKAARFQFSQPEAGTIVNRGNSIPLKLIFPGDVTTIDSVIYSVDGEELARKLDSGTVSLDTDKIAFGSRTLSARLFQQGKDEQIAYSNIVVVPKAPTQYTFSIVNTYPHDSLAYTQGLQYEQGVLYESTGRRGQSSLRKVNYQTGEVIKKIQLGGQYFGEGMTIVGDKIIQLTYLESVGFVYDKSTFSKIGEFKYNQSKEGWGLCYDGNRLIKSDGTSKLYFLNKDTYAEEGFIEVYDHKGPVDSLNELEYIDGKVYANVYTKDFIVIIDPETGAIEGQLNLIGIYPDKQANDNELNGIAYDKDNDRLFVTGKDWTKLFEIKMLER